jgi:uncharacterized protein YciW
VVARDVWKRPLLASVYLRVQIRWPESLVGSQEAIDGLHHAGWSDADILEAVEIIGFFNYYNRLVDALGVEPELEWSETRPPQAPETT